MPEGESDIRGKRTRDPSVRKERCDDKVIVDRIGGVVRHVAEGDAGQSPTDIVDKPDAEEHDIERDDRLVWGDVKDSLGLASRHLAESLDLGGDGVCAAVGVVDSQHIEREVVARRNRLDKRIFTTKDHISAPDTIDREGVGELTDVVGQMGHMSHLSILWLYRELDRERPGAELRRDRVDNMR